MTPDHINRFNKVSVGILKCLYKHFPDPSYPTPTSIGLTEETPSMVDGIYQNSDEYEDLSVELRRALLWLIQEGYVFDRGYKIGPSYVLTAQGLKVLGNVAPECRTPILIR